MDTSALLALIDADDAHHEAAAASWLSLLMQDCTMTCNNYVVVETLALVQHRLGIDAARVVQEDVVPMLEIDWIGADEHATAVTTLLLARRRRLSLVDCASFDTGRRLGIRRAFTLDRHFAEQGFECIPEVPS